RAANETPDRNSSSRTSVTSPLPPHPLHHLLPTEPAPDSCERFPPACPVAQGVAARWKERNQPSSRSRKPLDRENVPFHDQWRSGLSHHPGAPAPRALGLRARDRSESGESSLFHPAPSVLPGRAH